jgi:hypothetical protein
MFKIVFSVAACQTVVVVDTFSSSIGPMASAGLRELLLRIQRATRHGFRRCYKVKSGFKHWIREQF